LKLADREAVGANAALAALNAAKTASGSAAPEDPIIGNSWAIVPCVIAVEATYNTLCSESGATLAVSTLSGSSGTMLCRW
jgi:hypothetical protein